MPRAPKQEILNQESLDVPRQFLRFATPKEVSQYRAKRLKCDVLLEIGCGIGAQTIAFAQACKKVIAVEKNKELIEIAEKNAEKLGIGNIEFINDNALGKSVIQKVKKEKVNVLFCDTERKEAGERSINDLSPKVAELLKEYSFIDKIAIEIPPFTQDLNSLKENFEKEFISLNKKLNRLTLYFNRLKNTDVSVIALPSKAKIEYSCEKEKSKAKKPETASSAKGFNHLYIIDSAVALAGLTDVLALKINAKEIKMSNKTYFLSKEKISSEFSEFLECFDIISVCENRFDEIVKEMNRINAGKVVLRYNILPENYWNERKRYEDALKGSKKIHLFLDKEAVLCEAQNEKFK